MQTVPIKPEGTFNLNEIFKVIELMSLEDLEKVIGKSLHARAKKIAPSLSKRESELFQVINQGFPEAKFLRYDVLDEKRQDGTLTKKEHKELMAIIDEMEELELQRTEALLELSQLRGVPFQTLIKQLGIRPRENG